MSTHLGYWYIAGFVSGAEDDGMLEVVCTCETVEHVNLALTVPVPLFAFTVPTCSCSGTMCSHNEPIAIFFTDNDDEQKSDQLLGVTMESRNGQFAVSRILSVLFKYCPSSQAISCVHVQPTA